MLHLGCGNYAATTPKGFTMAKATTTTTTRNAAAAAAASVAASVANATLAPTIATPSVPLAALPTPAALALATTSTKQAAVWLAIGGNTQPPATLVLQAVGTAPHAPQGGQRYQHQTALLAALAALGGTATYGTPSLPGTVAHWVATRTAAQWATLGCAQHGHHAAQGGNVRCALSGRYAVLRAVNWA